MMGINDDTNVHVILSTYYICGAEILRPGIKVMSKGPNLGPKLTITLILWPCKTAMLGILHVLLGAVQVRVLHVAPAQARPMC